MTIMKNYALQMPTEPILLRHGGNDYPGYFLERQDGLVVPLVPADQLPKHIKLKGKRTMTMDEAFALGIQIVTLEPSKAQQSAAADRQTATQSYEHERPKTRIANAASNGRVIHSIEVTSASDSELGSESRDRAATQQHRSQQQYRQAGDPLKLYCSYWIHHGSCDFEQQGCKFLHEMPDQPTLRSIGFRSTPRWWAEENMSGRSRPVANEHDAGSKAARTDSHNSANSKIHKAHHIRPAIDRRSSAISTTESAQSDLIELSPKLPAAPFTTPITLNCTYQAESEPLANAAQRRASFKVEKHAVDEATSMRCEKGRKPGRLAYHKGGRKEASVAGKAKISGRAVHRKRLAAKCP